MKERIIKYIDHTLKDEGALTTALVVVLFPPLYLYATWDTNEMLTAIVIFIIWLVFGSLMSYIYLSYKTRLLKRDKFASLVKVDKMDGYKFEEYLSKLFMQLGYKVELTKKSKDHGADLIVRRKGITYIVQAKRYSINNKVGNKHILKTEGSRVHYKADKAIVITNSYFTKYAREVESNNPNIELIDRFGLQDLILRARKKI